MSKKISQIKFIVQKEIPLEAFREVYPVNSEISYDVVQALGNFAKECVKTVDQDSETKNLKVETKEITKLNK